VGFWTDKFSTLLAARHFQAAFPLGSIRVNQFTSVIGRTGYSSQGGFAYTGRIWKAGLKP
jgi:hypothetical protein